MKGIQRACKGNLERVKILMSKGMSKKFVEYLKIVEYLILLICRILERLLRLVPITVLLQYIDRRMNFYAQEILKRI